MDNDYTLDEFFALCLDGIKAEIAANEENLAQAGLKGGLKVFEGHVTHANGSGGGTASEASHQLTYYEFAYENPLVCQESGEEIPIELPSGSTCSFFGRGSTVEGRVQDHLPDEKRLVVGLRQTVGESGVSGKLEFDPSFLLTSLGQSIESVQRKSKQAPRLARRAEKFLYGEWLDSNREENESAQRLPEVADSMVLNRYQRNAVANTLADSHHLVWGPPGTGKTLTLGAAANCLRADSDDDEKILVTAHTNVALDNAIRAIVDQWGNAASDNSSQAFGQEVGLLRHDLPRHLDSSSQRFSAGLFDDSARDIPGFLDALHELEGFIDDAFDNFSVDEATSLRRRAGSAQQRAAILLEDSTPKEAEESKLGELASQLSELTHKAFRESLSAANIVCCTLSRLHIDFDTYSGLDWQKALVDEISMVGIAQLVPVLNLDCSIAGFGDFQQLPPIVQSVETAAKRGLGTHLFDWVDASDTDQRDPRRTMLERQYRMEEAICAPVRANFYNERLETAPSVQNRNSKFVSATGLLDTSNLDSEVEVAGKSKENRRHASLAKSTVRTVVDELNTADVGVIAPYAAQAERIRKKLKPLSRKHPTIEVSTVHSYQGREKEVIIFDSMTSPGEPMPFLSENRNPSINNMLNVAFPGPNGSYSSSPTQQL